MHKLLQQQIATYLDGDPEQVPEAFLRAVEETYIRGLPGAAQASEEQIRQAQKMEAVGRLAGGIAHDFNNLLTVIKGYCDLCRLEVKDGPLSAFVAEITRAADRAADLTGQLLAYSRQQVLQPTVIDLNDGIRDLRGMLVRVIGISVDLSFDLTEEPTTVLADPGQLQQVLMNLVINARDAMPDGGLVTIATEVVDVDEDITGELNFSIPHGPAVLLTVRDTGEGMADEVKEKIFDPFFTTKELGKGTGLGLSTVYGIVKQSDGYISVHSAEGRGSEFRIYLPLVDAELPEPEMSEAGTLSPLRAKLAGKRILVVEDEDPVRAILCRVLTQTGYRVLEASTPRDALYRFGKSKETVDLLVTDLVMPEMDGYELAAQLRSMQPGLRVLYISGYSPEAYENKGILRPGAHFLQKPFDTKSLLTKILVVFTTPEPESLGNLPPRPPFAR